MFGQLLKRWKDLINLMNEKGVPLPTVRDPKTGKGSISCTLVFVSSIIVIVGLIGKWSKLLGDIDDSNALQFFYASCALYFGRNLKSKNGDQLDQVGPQPPKTE